MTPADSNFVLCVVNGKVPGFLHTPASWQTVWEKEHRDGWFFINREGLLKAGQSPSTSEGTGMQGPTANDMGTALIGILHIPLKKAMLALIPVDL